MTKHDNQELFHPLFAAGLLQALRQEFAVTAAFDVVRLASQQKVESGESGIFTRVFFAVALKFPPWT